MRFRLSLLLSVFIHLSVSAQIKAITENGKDVFLYDDGSWSYVEKDSEFVAIDTISKPIFKNKKATFFLKSKNNNHGFWLDTSKWTPSTDTENNEAEYEFSFKDGDLYAMAITEEHDFPLINLLNLALDNLEGVAHDARIVEKELRTVNNHEVLYARLDATVEGVSFTFRNYYYSNETGCVQLCTYTATNLMEKYLKESDDFLNGLDIYN